MKSFGVCEAVVLRYAGNTVSLLSPQEGRVERQWYKTRYSFLHRGSLITYIPEKNYNGRMVAQNLSIEICATELAIKDMYLLHYLLEVCYYFVPLGATAEQAFHFLVPLFQKFDTFEHSFQKKIVICKLFILLGMCPEESAIQDVAQYLLQTPIDNLVSRPLELEMEKIMDRWLRWCREIHPKGRFFKAIPLLFEK